jgi:hypothetical protein
MKRIITALAAAGALSALVAAPAARADVLLSEPPRQSTVGDCIWLGIWYQSYSGGSRYVDTRVTYHGRTVARRTLRATTHWRDHKLYCTQWPDSGTYRLHIRGQGWSTIDRIRFAAQEYEG